MGINVRMPTSREIRVSIPSDGMRAQKSRSALPLDTGTVWVLHFVRKCSALIETYTYLYSFGLRFKAALIRSWTQAGCAAAAPGSDIRKLAAVASFRCSCRHRTNLQFYYVMVPDTQYGTMDSHLAAGFPCIQCIPLLISTRSLTTPGY